MKRFKLSLIAVTAVLLAGVTVLQSCRKEFFPEFSEENMDYDTTVIDGALAMPLIDTKMTIGNFIPELDSTLWVEADEAGLLHFRMYYKDVFTYSASSLFPDVTFPVPAGTIIPANMMKIKTDTMKLKIYNSSLQGHLFFKDPVIKFHVNNTVPMVTSFRMDTIAFHGDQVSSETANSNIYTVPAPASAGETTQKTVIIDKNQVPSLPDVFSPVPHFFSFVLTAGSEANQTIPYGLSGEELVTVDADVDLPMDAYLTDLVRVDSVDLDMNGATYGIIQSATLKIRLTNQMPIGGTVQIYFADSTATSADVLTNNEDILFTDLSQSNITAEGWNLVPAPVASLGAVADSTVNDFEITLEQSRLQALKDNNVVRMFVFSTLNTKNSENAEYVKIAAALKIGVKIGLRADYYTTVEEIVENIDTLSTD